MPVPSSAPAAAEPRFGSLMKLVEVTCNLAVQHDLDEILRIVTTGVCESLGCERASLFLYDEAAGELYTRIVTELEIEEIRFLVAHGIAGWVARKGRVANIPDPYVDARWNSSFDRKTGFRTRNILAAPVKSRRDGRMVGVLQLLNKSSGTFDDQDERVLEAFAAHAATALERAQLLEEARRHQALRLSIEMGRSIQASFLPDRLPAVAGYEIAAWWQPAEDVSGDYYDVLTLADGRLGLVVADVSGHGIGPSLIMAALRAMLRVVARTESCPAKVLGRLSESIYPDLQSSRFVTFLMAALDPVTHTVEFANAGHGPALHYDRAADAFRELQATSMPIGVLEDIEPALAAPVSLGPGDRLLLATDGAFELTNAQEEMFGVERLKRIIREHCDDSAADALAVLRSEITEFNPKVHPPDDVTLLVVRRVS